MKLPYTCRAPSCADGELTSGDTAEQGLRDKALELGSALDGGKLRAGHKEKIWRSLRAEEHKSRGQTAPRVQGHHRCKDSSV